MQWTGLREFWDMGGYGLYVWGSYLVMAAIIAFEIYQLKKGRGRTLSLLKRMRKFENESQT